MRAFYKFKKKYKEKLIIKNILVPIVLDLMSLVFLLTPYSACLAAVVYEELIYLAFR